MWPPTVRSISRTEASWPILPAEALHITPDTGAMTARTWFAPRHRRRTEFFIALIVKAAPCEAARCKAYCRRSRVENISDLARAIGDH